MADSRRRLRPVRPNLGIEVDYRRRLLKLIDEMWNSVKYWVTAGYRKYTPELAQDQTPATEIRKYFRAVARRWLKNWNQAAAELAKYFALKTWERSELQLRKILRDAGISVKFTMTPPMRDVFHAVIHENVSLIKSIPQTYLAQVEQLVMRSVAQGRKLDELTVELQQRYHVTRKRAMLIARDQNAKATTHLTRARQMDLGLQEGVWRHSHAGRVPRPTHVRNDGNKFNLAEGWFDPEVKKRIWPGTEINCRCFWTPVIAGFA